MMELIAKFFNYSISKLAISRWKKVTIYTNDSLHRQA